MANTLPFTPQTGDTLSPAYVHELLEGVQPQDVDLADFDTEDPAFRLVQPARTVTFDTLCHVANDSAITDSSGVLRASGSLGVSRTICRAQTSQGDKLPTSAEWELRGLQFRSYAQVGPTMTSGIPQGGLVRFYYSTELRSEEGDSSTLAVNLVPRIEAPGASWPQLGMCICDATVISGLSQASMWVPVVYKGLVSAYIGSDVVPGQALAAMGWRPYLYAYTGSALSLSDGIYCGLALGSGATGCRIPIWFMDPVFKAVAPTEEPGI